MSLILVHWVQGPQKSSLMARAHYRRVFEGRHTYVHPLLQTEAAEGQDPHNLDQLQGNRVQDFIYTHELYV